MARRVGFSYFKFLLDNNLTSKPKLLVYLHWQVSKTGNFSLNNNDDTELNDS